VSRPEESSPAPSPEASGPSTELRAGDSDRPSERTVPASDAAWEAFDPAQLAQLLVRLGCPPEKSAEMARQMDKRARQLAASQHRTYTEALQHLLGLMRQGWAAREQGL